MAPLAQGTVGAYGAIRHRMATHYAKYRGSGIPLLWLSLAADLSRMGLAV